MEFRIDSNITIDQRNEQYVKIWRGFSQIFSLNLILVFFALFVFFDLMSPVLEI